MVKKNKVKKTACKNCTGCGACGKNKNKTVRSKGIKAYYMPEPFPVNPYDDWDTAGTALYKDDRTYYNRFRGAKGETLDMFCNRKFDLERFEYMDFRNEDEMCEYLKHFGCLAVPMYGGRYGGFNGLSVIGQEGIRKEGWKNMKDALPVMKGEADAYRMAAEGEVYGYIIADDGSYDTPDDPKPKLVFEYGDIDGDDVDSCWGYYGEDEVIDAAKEAYDWNVQKRDEKLAKEQRMLQQDRRYTIVKKGSKLPKNARAVAGNMRVGDSITLRDGTVLTRTANWKPGMRSVKKTAIRRRR